MDVLSNLQKYADIDYYEKNLLKQNDSLAAPVSISDETITLEDASSFPKRNGYVRIGSEIIFYATRTDTELQETALEVSVAIQLWVICIAHQISKAQMRLPMGLVRQYIMSAIYFCML